MTTLIKFKGIKKAISDYNNAISRGLHTIFYMDIATRIVWCNVYADCNSWNQYHTSTIHRVDIGMVLNEDNEKLTMKLLNDACNYTINQ